MSILLACMLCWTSVVAFKSLPAISKIVLHSPSSVQSRKYPNLKISSLFGTLSLQNEKEKGKFHLISIWPKHPIFKVFKKAINIWGIIFGIQCCSIMCLWFIGMLLFMPFKLLFPKFDKDGIVIDSLGRWWSRLVSFPHSIPTVTGIENLPPKTEPCIYIANHASWMDIPILGGYLPPLKFVCKKELTKVSNC